MLTNTMPFVENVEHNWMIVKAQREKRYLYPNKFNLSIICRMSIDTMMTFDPDKRPTINQCCQLFWFRSEYKKSAFKSIITNRQIKPFEKLQFDSFNSLSQNENYNTLQKSKNNVNLTFSRVNSKKNQQNKNNVNETTKLVKTLPNILTTSNVLKKKILP